MKPRRFILYFNRFGEPDWVVKERGKRARLTRHFQFVGTFKAGQLGEQIWTRQPRAVIAGCAVVKYSRMLTQFVGAA